MVVILLYLKIPETAARCKVPNWTGHSYQSTVDLVPDPPYHESKMSAIGDIPYGGYPAIHRDAGDPSMVQGFDLVEQRSASTVVLASTVP